MEWRSRDPNQGPDPSGLEHPWRAECRRSFLCSAIAVRSGSFAKILALVGVEQALLTVKSRDDFPTEEANHFGLFFELTKR